MLRTSLEYRDGDMRLTGYLVDGKGSDPAPGVVIFHGGAGLDDHARQQTERYADLGFVALAADLFGPGVMGDREKVIAAIGAIRGDRELLRRRASAAQQALVGLPGCSGTASVVGFCFGGLAALEYARSGADLTAVVSIHGNLETNQPAQPGSLRPRILACHGAADPHVPMAQTAAFAAEMEAAGADWELVVYGGAMHGFTHRDAVGPAARPGVEYNERADALSFARAAAFLAEGFHGRASG
jgi:dienelactone hydrolase